MILPLSDYWNNGLATETALAVQNHGFEVLGFTRLISIIEATNIASIRVAEKNGMTLEKAVLFKDKIPVKIFSIETSI